MDREKLTRPFEPHQIRQRPGQHGKTLCYVDVAAVIQRLNDSTTDAAWSFEIVSHEVQDGEALVLARLTVEGVTKMAFGGCALTIDKEGTVVSLADDFKTAASDALKKAASMFGVALELYGAAPAHQPERPKTLASVRVDDRVTTRQLSALHSASRRRGLGQDGLVALVQERAGKDTITALTKGEASSLISELTGTNGGGR